jgi:hypothetical protein
MKQVKLTLTFLFYAFWRVAAVSPEQILHAEFVADGNTFYNSGKGTPAEYITNMRGKLIREAAIVRGGECGNYQEAVQKLADCYEMAQTGMTWKQTPVVVPLKKLFRRPTIDGRFCLAEWTEANQFQGEFLLGKTKKSNLFDTQWLIGTYENSLFIAVRFQDVDQNSIPYQAGKSSPWLGDALEVFIRPDLKDLFYYELVVNLEGELCTFWHLNDPYGGYHRLKECTNTAIKVKTSRTAREIIFELEIPMNELHPAWCQQLPKKGDVFSFMLCRSNCDNWGKRHVTTPVPFLYDGHNIFGYISAIFP